MHHHDFHIQWQRSGLWQSAPGFGQERGVGSSRLREAQTDFLELERTVQISAFHRLKEWAMSVVWAVSGM